MKMALNEEYMKNLRVAMRQTSSNKARRKAAKNIRRSMKAEIELKKLETELCSRASIDPTDGFMMKKRIAQIMREERKEMDAVGTGMDMCEGATIGGTYGK